MSSIDLPLGLRHALEGGNCVLFIGAGVGQHLIGPDGRSAPDGETLAKELASHFSIDAAGQYDLALISTVVELNRGRKELETFLRTRLANLEPDEHFRWLLSLRWRSIYTTNYDHSIPRAFELNPKPVQNPVIHAASSDLINYDPHFQVPIYFLHGSLFGPSKPEIVITQGDYQKFRERRRMLFELLKRDAATCPILYVGYSHRDPNWRIVMDELREDLLPSHPQQSFRVTRGTTVLEREVLKAQAIECIDTSFEEFTKALQASLASSHVDADTLGRLQSTVPRDLIPAFTTNPAATVRLLASWQYVNQANFSESSNVNAFLKGDRANWALIAKRDYFQRDIESDLYEECLDYATTEKKRSYSLLVKGSAGYGISTLLMTLAGRLVNERAGPTFHLKPGAWMKEGDIEFACSVFESRPFFLVDSAADHKFAITRALARLRELEQPALFVLGERVNEWRQAGLTINAKEFALEPLSDPEIERLLDLLSAKGALGVLGPLSRDLQAAAIRNKHSKELLVALREATEGKGFDAILEDEFRGIGGDLAQKLYLTVCCFYQFGALVRAQLLGRLLEVTEVELYELTGKATEGVVIYDDADPQIGQFVARARHRKIAEVVWERCGDRGERERILQIALTSLNLNYGSDKSAFDQFVRSDHLVDAIRTLDGKIKYFDAACRKDPTSPYVRQHYARMLAREGKAELALGQIDTAIELNPKIRVLYHTKGKVLSELALSIESHDIARKRLAQSEAEFRHGLSLKSNDEYCYQGLAELYFGWAKRGVDEAETQEYLERAERIISEGLNVVSVREGLWVVSADIASFIGDDPKRVQALKKAVQDSPRSIYARYLLGKTYRKSGNTDKAIETLAPLVKDHPEEFRACDEYARALLEKGKSYEEAIAVLRLGTLYGYRDPRFIATLGGLLFLNGEFTEADKVFEEANKQGLSADERHSIEFRPRDPAQPDRPLVLKGSVHDVRIGYAFVDVSGYPRLLSPGSRWNGVRLVPGLTVECELVFAAKGPNAVIRSSA